MNKTNDFKYNLPAYSDPVDIEDLNDNFRGIDDALMAGLCKKDYTGNNMGSSDPSARKYAWAPWFEIVNDNEFDVVVTDRNAPVESEEATINIAAGQTFRKYINGRYYMNFYVQDQHDVTFKWFTNAETYINESGGGGGGTGTVTSVSVQGGSGSHLTASGNPIETSGTITIDIDDGYSIPSDNEQTAWDGKAADLKAEIDSSTYVLTLQLKDSAGNLIGTAKTIDLPLETMVVDGEYDSQTKKIKLELKNGNYVEFSVADLVSGLQTELSASNKLDPDYIDYDASHRAVSDTEKGTWNGKQNALTFDDTPTQNSNNPVKSGGIYTALAGKQASLDSTQLAAVNSGIDSAKVAQISTNQTNILYAMDHGAKNLFNMYKWMNECSVVGGNKSVDSNYTLTLGATSSNCYTEYEGNTYPSDVEIYVQPNEQYVMTWGYIRTGGSGRGTVYVVFIGSTGETTVSVSAEIKKIEFTTPAGTYGLRVYIKQTTRGLYESYAYMMICSKVVWDTFGSGYQPPSVPNYDLTRLQSEDRAALADVVDNGAKNVAEIYNITQNAITITTSGYKATFSGSASQDGSITWGKIHVDKTGDYILYCNMSTSAGRFTVYNQTDSVILRSFYPTDNLTPIVLSLVAGKNYTVYSWFAAGTASACVIDLMICTKAAFGVSNKFVPYRPNYDLVCKRASGYFITSETATFAGLLGSAVAAAGFGTTATSHSGLCSVSTTTDDEYLLFYWYYSYNVFCECIQTTAKSISLTNKNNQGTIVVTGGTAPYKVTVTVFN